MRENKPIYTNAIAIQLAKQKALERARNVLEKQGVSYPQYDSKLSSIELYDLVMDYGKKESELMVQFMREPSGPRPIIEPGKRPDPTKPLYERYKDD